MARGKTLAVICCASALALAGCVETAPSSPYGYGDGYGAYGPYGAYGYGPDYYPGYYGPPAGFGAFEFFSGPSFDDEFRHREFEERRREEFRRAQEGRAFQERGQAPPAASGSSAPPHPRFVPAAPPSLGRVGGAPHGPPPGSGGHPTPPPSHGGGSSSSHGGSSSGHGDGNH